jgi:hypothetical protein
MIDTLDTLALAACAKGLPADTPLEQVDRMRRAIVSTLDTTWQPAPSSDGGRPRTPFHALVRRAVRNAGYSAKTRKARWMHVCDVFVCGSTFAIELCRGAGADPDELVGEWQR